jgi:glycosyltransferase involved in cell wall biosynthesis
MDMKILQICPDFPPYVKGGGAETFRLLAEIWAKNGNDVCVVTSFPANSSVEQVGGKFEFSTKYFKLLPAIGIFKEAAYFFPPGVFETIRLIRLIRSRAKCSDVIVIHGIMEALPLISLFTLRKFSSKIVVTNYGISTATYSKLLNTLSRMLYRSIGKIAISSVSDIFVYSDNSKREFDNLFNNGGQFRIHRHNLGIDVAKFSQIYDEVLLKEKQYNEWLTEELGISGQFVLSIGRNVRTKGFDILIEVFSKLRLEHSNLTLIIAGDITDYTEELKKLSRRLNIDGKVKFIGRIDEFQKVYLMIRCRCLIIPSRKEGYGLNAVEARILTISTVATKTGAHEEILGRHENNILISPESVEQLHDAVLKILELPPQKPEFDIVAAKKYDISNLAQKYIDFANSKLKSE